MYESYFSGQCVLRATVTVSKGWCTLYPESRGKKHSRGIASSRTFWECHTVPYRYTCNGTKTLKKLSSEKIDARKVIRKS